MLLKFEEFSLLEIADLNNKNSYKFVKKLETYDEIKYNFDTEFDRYQVFFHKIYDVIFNKNFDDFKINTKEKIEAKKSGSNFGSFYEKYKKQLDPFLLKENINYIYTVGFESDNLGIGNSTNNNISYLLTIMKTVSEIISIELENLNKNKHVAICFSAVDNDTRRFNLYKNVLIKQINNKFNFLELDKKYIIVY